MTATKDLEARSAAVRGLETAWLEGGAGGEAVVFLHGYLDAPESWSAQSEVFAAERRVLLPYGRGVGPSRAPADRRRYGAYSILLDHLELLRLWGITPERPVHLVGHDLGGIHAWLLAAHAGAAVKSATIINSAHPRQFLGRALASRQWRKSWYIGAVQAPWLPELGLRLFKRRLLAEAGAQGWRPPKEPMTSADFKGIALNAVNQYRELARDIPRFLLEKAAPVAAPVMVVSCEDDPYLEEPSMAELSGLADKVVIRVVRGKHWLQREQPERVNRLLKEFWDGTR